jgi:hypothetical protein
MTNSANNSGIQLSQLLLRKSYKNSEHRIDKSTP